MHLKLRAIVYLWTAAAVAVGFGGEPAPTDVDIWTAVLTDDIDAVKQHIAAGKNLDGKEPIGGSTPLTLASIFGKTEVAQALIEGGASVNLSNNDGTTPLHAAAFFCHPKIVESLLENGADVHRKNHDGSTPLDAMATDWSAELEGVYKLVFRSLNIDLNLDRIKQTRPVVARLLREHTKTNAGKTPGSVAPNRRATKTVKMHRVVAVTRGDWATYNYNVAGWRYNDHETTLNPTNIQQLRLKWRFPRQGGREKVGVIHATPSVVDGYVYFGTVTYGTFYCLSPDGELVWKYDVGGIGRRWYREVTESRGLIPQDGVYTSALVTDDSVYFADGVGVMYCLDRKTGRKKWQVDSKIKPFPEAHHANIVMASPIRADGKIIFGGGAYQQSLPLDANYKCCYGRGFVVALDPASGSVVWKHDVGPRPEEYDPPIVIKDAYGEHVFHFGPSTSSVWCTPSWDKESNTVFFGTDIHNSPRKPTKNDPRNYTEHSCAVIAISAADGSERWVSQIAAGDVWNFSMPAYDVETKRYKDLSIGDTPKLYTIEIDGNTKEVVGAGCKNGGYYVLDRNTGEILGHTPVYTGPPMTSPKTEPRTLALPGPIGGLQTGCATDGRRVYTNGVDKLPNPPSKVLTPNPPTGGRVIAISLDAASEYWRHERPKIDWIGGTRAKPLFRNCGDPIASGIALANGVAFCTTFSSNKLLCLDAETGELLKDFSIGPVLCGPSVSRGQVYVGTGNTQFSNTPGEAFFPKRYTGELLVFGLSDN